MTSATSTEPFFLDCDTGIDDALALAWLVASPGVELVGVGAVSGNVDVDAAARNTLDLLALLGRPDVPVHRGALDPLRGPFDGGAPDVHGADGVGGTSGGSLPRTTARVSGTDAATALVEAARAHPGRLRVLAIGPLTNLALALDLEPDLPRLVRELVVMGGAALAPGNVTAVAEANIASDPLAAARVVEAGFDLVLVGLDVTMHHLLEESDREALLAAGTPATAALAEMVGFYSTFYAGTFARPCTVLHDPLAAAVATGDLPLALAPRVPVVVDTTDGPGRAQTICDLREQYAGTFAGDSTGVGPGTARVVLEVSGEVAPLLLERLLRL